MAIAAISFAANLAIALLLQHGAKDDLNIRSAFWHMLADAWVSLGVILSGGAIVATDWTVLDPLDQPPPGWSDCSRRLADF